MEGILGNKMGISYTLGGQVGMLLLRDIRIYVVNYATPNGRRTLQQYEYNARGQIIGIVDGNHNPVSYDVDSWGHITGIGL